MTPSNMTARVTAATCALVALLAAPAGWLGGSTPETPIDELIDSQAEANFWDPSTQLRVIKRKRKPPPYPEPTVSADPAGWGD